MEETKNVSHEEVRNAIAQIYKEMEETLKNLEEVKEKNLPKEEPPSIFDEEATPEEMEREGGEGPKAGRTSFSWDSTFEQGRRDRPATRPRRTRFSQARRRESQMSGGMRRSIRKRHRSSFMFLDDSPSAFSYNDCQQANVRISETTYREAYQ